jgi:hypothetical protein
MMNLLHKLFTLTIVAAVSITGQAVPPSTHGIGAKAHAFDISQVIINDSRLKDNEVIT